MPKFVYIYHGGKMPETAEEGEREMARWTAWFGDMGEAVVDGGAPVGMSSTVYSDGTVTSDGGSNPVSGYSVVQADDLDVAIAMARGCPLLAGGGSVEIAERIEMGDG